MTTKRVLHEAERATGADTARAMLESGLVVNTSGNVSVRIGEHVQPRLNRYIKQPRNGAEGVGMAAPHEP